MPIDERLVKWDEDPKNEPKIDSRLVKWDEEKPVSSIGTRIKRGMVDPIDAGAQLLTHALPDSVVTAGNRLNNFIADKTGLVDVIPNNSLDQNIANKYKDYVAPKGMDFARIGGNLISPANIALASRLPVATTALGKVATSTLGGGGLSALTTPVEGGDFWKEKAKQAGVGLITGGLAQPIIGGLSRLISPKASVNPNVKLLQSEGVNPTIGQTLGGVANRVEEKMTSLPIVGDMISRARGVANNQFETAAHNRALAPIGDKLPEGVAGRDAVVYTENALKNKYDEVLNKIGAIKPDQQFADKIDNLTGMVKKMVMPNAEKAKFNAALSDVKSSIDANGYLTSDAYKALESQLGSDAANLSKSANIYESRLGPAVKQLQQELKGMLQRQAGDSADELQKVNAGWANFKRVQNAAGKVGAEEGKFTPPQLQNAVRALDKSKDKGAFARGNAVMQDLSDAGKSVLGNKVPNSFTADRFGLNALAVGGGMLQPTAMAGLLGGSALYTQPAQKALNALVTKRPELAAQAAQLLRRNSNYVLPASGAVGLGLLDN